MNTSARAQDALVVYTCIQRDTSRSRTLGGLGRHDPTVAATAVRPQTRQAGMLLRDLLISTGKASEVTGNLPRGDEAWAAALGWLITSGVTDVIIIDAQYLNTPTLTEVMERLCGAGLRTWLVTHKPERPHTREVASWWPGVEVGEAEFDRLWARPPSVASAPELLPVEVAFPRVVASEFVYFLDDCDRLLPAASARLVEHRFQEAAATTRAYFAEVKSRRSLDNERVLVGLRRLVDECRFTDEIVCCIRAFQVEAFLEGWLVNVDLPLLRARAHLAPRRAKLDTAVFSGLSVYIRTIIPTCAVLAAHGLTAEEIAVATLADLDDARWVISVGANEVDIHDGARPILAAHLLSRYLSGAAEGDRLIVSSRRQPLEPKAIRTVLATPVVEVGVITSGFPFTHDRLTPFQWASRLGIKLRAIRTDRTGGENAT